MTIGFLQFSPVLGDPQASIERVKAAIDSLSSVDLLVLPELSNSGYNFSSRQQAEASAERIGEGDFSRFLMKQSSERNCHIVAGINERDGDRLYNSAVLFGPKRVIGKYRKMHLYLNEQDYFEPGDIPPAVFDLKGTKVSILVCFDWAFPELWRMAALAGAEVICHPSNIMAPARALKGLAGHALCNRVFIVTANRIGREGDLTFGGMSTVLSPDGDILAQAPTDRDDLIIIDIDPERARNKMLSRRNHVLDDRRPEMYVSLTQPKRKP